MLRVIRFFLWLFFRVVLSLRYRVRLIGWEKVRDLKGPILILPNHPAFVDPCIVLRSLWFPLRPRPLLLESNFNNPLFRPLMTIFDALRVPNLDSTSAEARGRAQRAIQGVIDALEARQNVILWPSGRLSATGSEHLGAARTLADVLKAVPEAKVVVVRTRGLWGSSFSCAFTGQRPHLGKQVLRGVWVLFANLLFFAPRRQVDITLEHIERSRLPEPERERINPWFEAWYNRDAPEKPTFVPAHFLFGARSYEFPPLPEVNEVDLSRIKPETRIAINEMVGEKIGRRLGESQLRSETTLDELGIDSIDRQDLSLSVERRFGFAGDHAPVTLGQLYALAQGLLERRPPKPPPPAWFSPVAGSDRMEILGETVGEAFVRRAAADLKEVCCADDLSGALTYERLLVGALCLARRFARLPEPNVGVLLPSSVAGDIALMGLYLAGKLPVMLNWTTGPANLAHAAKTMGLAHVITAKAFMDRIGARVPGTDYLFLEDLGKSIGKFEKLRTLLAVRWFPSSILKNVPRPSPDSPAVVLFTSGSEKAPKAVPLTHRNIFTNQREGMAAIQMKRSDSILGFLPAFHSFGMSITGLIPLLTGMRVVRHPDPTDAAALARKIGAYKPTLLVGTPTFLSYILERAKPGELASLRMVIVGAENCPRIVFARFAEAAPKAVVLEGYGITECGPVVSVSPPDGVRPGTVGKPLASVEVCVADLSEIDEAGEHHFSGRMLPSGQMGMLLVSGPTIFPGYLGHDGPSPFLDHGGKRWYVTGDLVEIDEAGHIRFLGRLKRFLKAGGEMISLPALEEPFVKSFPPTKDGPRVAVEGMEIEGGGRRVVLFSTEEISLQEANAVLVKEGFQRVMRLDEVRRIDKVPMLETGKTAYKVLRAQVLPSVR